MNKLKFKLLLAGICGFGFAFSTETKSIEMQDAFADQDSVTIVADMELQEEDFLKAEDLVFVDVAEKAKEVFPNLTDNEMLLYKDLHPMSVAFVKGYKQKHEKRLSTIKEKYARQLQTIDRIMAEHNLPYELRYLAIIESELSNSALSRKGASGPWQFMAPTARLMGLTVNRHRDERRDLVKSTHAAAKYLKQLHQRFDDWYLVIAAYNCGPGRLESAIRRSGGSRDFWKVQNNLPLESRNHVKKYIGAQFVFNYLEQKDNLITPLINVDVLSVNQTGINYQQTLMITGKYNKEVIAKHLDMHVDEFSFFNPGFDSEVVVKEYQLKLPKEKMEQFKARKQDILKESVEIILNENKSIIASEASKQAYPEPIALPQPKTVRAKEISGNRRK